MTDVLVRQELPGVDAGPIAPATREALQSERNAAILRRWDTGEPGTSIAPDFGLTPQAVGYIARQAGREPRHVRGGRPRDSAFVAAADAGLTYTQIAARNGVTRGAVAGAICRAKQRASA